METDCSVPLPAGETPAKWDVRALGGIFKYLTTPRIDGV